jgi:ankyrin repeat protein
LDRDPISRLYTIPDYQVIGLELGLYDYDYLSMLQNIKPTDSLLDQLPSIDEVDKNNRTLTFYACKLGNYSLVTKLLKRSSDFNRPCGANDFTPLMAAVCYHHVRIVLRLLSHKDVQSQCNVHDRNGHTAFSYACQLGQLDLIRDFISRNLVTPHQVRYNLEQYRSTYVGTKGKDILGVMFNYLKTDHQ